MRSEIEELRPKLKEILYDCAVEIRATKAALFVYDGVGRFELLTEYGFRGNVRTWTDFNDPIVDRCGRGRTAFYLNGLTADPRFSPVLFESSTDRLLVAPLYARGKLVGFIDLRDKAAQAPFEQADATKAQHIADRMVDVFAEKNLFGHHFIALAKHTAATPEPAATPVATPVVAPPPPPPPAPPPTAPAPRPAVVADPHAPRLGALVAEARSAVSRIVVAPAQHSFRDDELAAAKDVLRSVLMIPGAVVASFSAFGHLGGLQEIAARSTLGDDAKYLVQAKVNAWLAKRGEVAGAVRTTVHTPFGTSTPPITATEIQKVYTAPVNVGGLRGLYLTVAFAGNPDRVAHELMAVLHAHLQLVIEQSMERGDLRDLRARIAEKLLEPDFSKYPELRRHVDAVASLAEQFARYLALSPSEVETVRIVALVHDVGMRLLEFDRLYRKREVTEEELAFLRQHPIVGAAMVEPLLGSEIAHAVLSHHERVDGDGYPNGLRGDQIPLLARLVQICDAWIAITDTEGYQTPEPAEVALAMFRVASGSQFDSELCVRFMDMVRAT